ncbi:hypothetical protein EYZ11_009879 [Aspergillus tanneri]|uniref:Squalene cyclase N-terminal domain-containing protein n=1 Tax=Aspergillus tanneri TaxID=1220188 RepID=A0A4V3UNC5_9EURO|nr:hypothetical protein EYZ11_009879 [Aspergillus tanneri]
MPLHIEACDATKRAGTYALRQVREDGHWYGFSIETDQDDLVKYFLSEQNRDGSWSIAYDYPGDASTTAEAYFALCLLGLDATTKRCALHASSSSRKVA